MYELNCWNFIYNISLVFLGMKSGRSATLNNISTSLVSIYNCLTRVDKNHEI